MGERLMMHDRSDDRLPGHLLRRIAQHVASRVICERVLFPLLADLQFEHARARSRWARVVVQARGVLAFWSALGVTSAIDGGQHLWANAWATGDEEARATKRLFGMFCGATTATALVILTLGWRSVRMVPGNAFALLLPSTLAIAVPAGVLFAFAMRASAPSLLVHRRGVRSVAVLAALATFVVVAWLTPAANHEYRVRMNSRFDEMFWNVRMEGNVTTYSVPRPTVAGDREMTLDELSIHSADLRSRGWNDHAARFDVEWHKKPALAALCLAIALAGAAISATRRPGVFRFCAALIVGWVPWALLRVGEQAADNGHLLPALAMWGPVALVVVAALATLRLAQRRRQAESSKDSFGTGSSPA